MWSSDGAAGVVGSLREDTIHKKQEESWQLREGISKMGEVDYDEELLCSWKYGDLEQRK